MDYGTAWAWTTALLYGLFRVVQDGVLRVHVGLSSYRHRRPLLVVIVGAAASSVLLAFPAPRFPRLALFIAVLFVVALVSAGVGVRCSSSSRCSCRVAYRLVAFALAAAAAAAAASTAPQPLPSAAPYEPAVLTVLSSSSWWFCRHRVVLSRRPKPLRSWPRPTRLPCSYRAPRVHLARSRRVLRWVASTVPPARPPFSPCSSSSCCLLFCRHCALLLCCWCGRFGLPARVDRCRHAFLVPIDLGSCRPAGRFSPGHCSRRARLPGLWPLALLAFACLAFRRPSVRAVVLR